jgi:hypothetical protein
LDPLVQRPEFGIAAGRQGRQLDPPFDPLGPTLDHRRRRTGQHRIGADLIEIAELPRRKGLRERRGDDDLALHLDDEFADFGRPAGDLLGAHPGAVLQIVIGPDVDDLVERSDLGVEEGGETLTRSPNAFSNLSSTVGRGPGCKR